jgi:hypothetical protein
MKIALVADAKTVHFYGVPRRIIETPIKLGGEQF